jgi:hypothetical protein
VRTDETKHILCLRLALEVSSINEGRKERGRSEAKGEAGLIDSRRLGKMDMHILSHIGNFAVNLPALVVHSSLMARGFLFP